MVKVYMLNVTDLPDSIEYPGIMDGLSGERKEKIIRQKKELARKQSLGAGLLLKNIFEKQQLKMEEIYYEENGKPKIDGIFFNISHSGDFVICAVSEKPVGCDIEKIGQIRKGFAERYFSQKETAHLDRFEDKKRWDEFYRLWTIKESYVKMKGEGLGKSLEQIECMIGDDVCVIHDGKRSSCHIKEYQVPGYKVTICAEEKQFAQEIKKEVIRL